MLTLFNELNVYSRRSVIIPELVGKIVKVHNGKILVEVEVNAEMLGYKLGEFVPTKITPIYKRNKRK